MHRRRRHCPGSTLEAGDTSHAHFYRLFSFYYNMNEFLRIYFVEWMCVSWGRVNCVRKRDK